MQKSIALQCQAMCVTYLGLWLETLLPELVTRKGDLCGWAESVGAASAISEGFFHAVTRLWLFSSAARPASLGSKAVRTALPNEHSTAAGGLPPRFIHCGPRFYLAKLLHSQNKFNAVSDTMYGYCTLTFNYIKSYYNHFLYNKSSLTPEKLSSHGCSAVFLK